MKAVNKGFTLIELMIVVAVIGVLAAIAIPQYQNYVAKAELGGALSSVSALKTNVEDFIANKGAFPVEATDPASSLGAPTPNNGSIKFGVGTNSIDYAITSGSEKVIGVTLSLKRDATNQSWSCEVSKGTNTLVNDAVLPKNCIFSS
ncbi:MAG: pilin [Plesiomonas shigelloides]